MPYRITGIDVHKKMLAVVVSDVEVEGEYHFERRRFGSNPEQLRSPAAWTNCHCRTVSLPFLSGSAVQ